MDKRTIATKLREFEADFDKRVLDDKEREVIRAGYGNEPLGS